MTFTDAQAGIGLKQAGRFHKALTAFRAAAVGNAAAHTHIGLAFCHGYGGVSQDATEALYWYRRAAELGDASGITAVGECLLHGAGVEQDLELGVWWLRRAAEKGDADAMCALGWCYANGVWVDENVFEAAEWYLRAAQRGSVRAMCHLAACYRSGDGAPQHLALAAAWHGRAGITSDRKSTPDRSRRLQRWTIRCRSRLVPHWCDAGGRVNAD